MIKRTVFEMAAVFMTSLILTGCTAPQKCTADDAIESFKEIVAVEEIGIDFKEMNTWDFRAEDQIEQYEIFARAPDSMDDDYVLVGRVNSKNCAARVASY